MNEIQEAFKKFLLIVDEEYFDEIKRNDEADYEWWTEIVKRAIEVGYNAADMADNLCMTVTYDQGYKAGQESAKCCGSCKWYEESLCDCDYCSNPKGLTVAIMDDVCPEWDAR